VGAAEDYLMEEGVVASLLKTRIFKREHAEEVAAIMEKEGCFLGDLFDPEEVSDEELATYITRKSQLSKFIKYRAGGATPPSSSGGGSITGAGGAEEPPAASPAGIIIPYPSFPALQEAAFEDLFQDDKKFSKKEKTLEIAAGQIAELIAAVLQAYTGNIPGLALNFVGNIRNLTLSFGLGAIDEESYKAHVTFDRETGYFLMCTLAKTSKKRNAQVPFFKASKTELTIAMSFTKIKAGNDAAREKLQLIANEKAEQLVQNIQELEVFF